MLINYVLFFRKSASPNLGVDFDANGKIVTASSSAIVTYNLFNPISANAKKEYTLIDSDYTDSSLTALNSMMMLILFLVLKLGVIDKKGGCF